MFAVAPSSIRRAGADRCAGCCGIESWGRFFIAAVPSPRGVLKTSLGPSLGLRSPSDACERGCQPVSLHVGVFPTRTAHADVLLFLALAFVMLLETVPAPTAFPRAERPRSAGGCVCVHAA